MNWKTMLIGTTVTALTGCAAVPEQQESRDSLFEVKKFNAPLGKRLEVETGKALFVEGAYIDGQVIYVKDSLDMMIPGAMRIPFPIHIAAGPLPMTRISFGWRYYCAPEGKAAASFPGLGSVIKGDDCVGIRIALNGKKAEWVVDNSNHNRGMTTVWTRDMTTEEKARYQPEKSNDIFRIRDLKRIVFNGYYGGQLHFSWEESTNTNKDAREFVFDYKGMPTTVGIKGYQFTVLGADNVKVSYEWIKFN